MDIYHSYIDNNKDPRKSEIHFFDIYWKKGIDFYKKKFDYSKKIVGEKTPDLMYLTYTFPLIQSVNPYIKIIIVWKFFPMNIFNIIVYIIII